MFMKKIPQIFVGLVAVSVISMQLQGGARESVKPMSTDVHVAWLSERIKEAKSVKPGMSRMDLLKVFEVEAGLQAMLPTRYALKSCPMMKVDVTFDGAGKRSPEKRPVPVQADAEMTILTISPIYVDYVIAD